METETKKNTTNPEKICGICENCGKKLGRDESCMVEENTACFDCLEIMVKRTQEEKTKLCGDDSVYIYVGKNARKNK